SADAPAAAGAEGSAPADEEGGDGAAEQPPAWRRLRAQIWRQSGTWGEGLDKLFTAQGPDARDRLVDLVAEKVAASLIQQRERTYDLVDGLIGSLVDQYCLSNQHADDWDFDALEEALHEQFALEIPLKRKVGEATQLAEQIWEAVEVRLGERMEELSRA